MQRGFSSIVPFCTERQTDETTDHWMTSQTISLTPTPTVWLSNLYSSARGGDARRVFIWLMGWSSLNFHDFIISLKISFHPLICIFLLIVSWLGSLRRTDGWMVGMDGWACAELKIIARLFVIASKTDFMVAEFCGAEIYYKFFLRTTNRHRLSWSA